MLELWGMQSTPSLLLVPGSLWLRVVAPESVLSMDKKNCLAFKLSANKLFWLELLEIELLDHLTVYKKMTDI